MGPATGQPEGRQRGHPQLTVADVSYTQSTGVDQTSPCCSLGQTGQEDTAQGAGSACPQDDGRVDGEGGKERAREYLRCRSDFQREERPLSLWTQREM